MQTDPCSSVDPFMPDMAHAQLGTRCILATLSERARAGNSADTEEMTCRCCLSAGAQTATDMEHTSRVRAPLAGIMGRQAEILVEIRVWQQVQPLAGHDVITLRLPQQAGVILIVVGMPS